IVAQQMLHCEVSVRCQAQTKSAEPLLKWWVLVDQLMCHVDVDATDQTDVDNHGSLLSCGDAGWVSIPTCPENEGCVVREPNHHDQLEADPVLQDLPHLL